MEDTYLWLINIVAIQHDWLLLPALFTVLFAVYGLVIWGLLRIFGPIQDEIDGR